MKRIPIQISTSRSDSEENVSKYLAGQAEKVESMVSKKVQKYTSAQGNAFKKEDTEIEKVREEFYETIEILESRLTDLEMKYKDLLQKFHDYSESCL